MKTRKGYLVKRGKTYHAMWTVNGKKFMQSTRCTVESKARKELSRIMQPHLIENDRRHLETVKTWIESAKTDLASLNEQKNPPLPLAGTWSAFKGSQNRPRTGKATFEKYEIQWSIFHAWMEKNQPEVKALRDVTPEIAGQFAAHLISTKRSSGTFNKYMNVLSLIFRTVSEEARLTVNPWANPQKDGHGKGIRRMEKEIHGRRELTLSELQDVCAKADGDLRFMLAIGIYTGMRLGDVATLRWGEVDLIRGIITRIPNKTGRKNPEAVRIPLYPTLWAMLEEVPKVDRVAYVLPRIAADYRRHSSYVTDRIQALFKKCNIQTTRKIEGRHQSQVEVGFHSLRHSFVSMCSENKVPLAIVQGMIGHTNPAMTRHYDHAEHESDKFNAVALLPSMSKEPVKAPPLTQSPFVVDAGTVLGIVNAMTAKNWELKKAELIQLASQSKEKAITPAS
jgi:integrase